MAGPDPSDSPRCPRCPGRRLHPARGGAYQCMECGYQPDFVEVAGTLIPLEALRGSGCWWVGESAFEEGWGRTRQTVRRWLQQPGAEYVLWSRMGEPLTFTNSGTNWAGIKDDRRAAASRTNLNLPDPDRP